MSNDQQTAAIAAGRESLQEEKQRVDAGVDALAEPTIDARACGSCGDKIDDPEALFCPQCGSDVAERTCPACGKTVYALADLCGHCGTWLLGDVCRFCHAPRETAADFCAQCGAPSDGIACPGCGEKNFFDFCPRCHMPLTEEASQAMVMLASDVEHQLWEENSLSAAERTLLDKAASGDEIQLPDAPRGRSFPPSGRFSSGYLEVLINEEKAGDVREARRLEEERRRQEEERKRLEAEAARQKKEQEEALREARRKQEELRKAAEAMRVKKFKDNREARIYHEMHRPNLPGDWWWQCNYYHVYHKPGPSECGEPCLGGQWVNVAGLMLIPIDPDRPESPCAVAEK